METKKAAAVPRIPTPFGRALVWPACLAGALTIIAAFKAIYAFMGDAAPRSVTDIASVWISVWRWLAILPSRLAGIDFAGKAGLTHATRADQLALIVALIGLIVWQVLHWRAFDALYGTEDGHRPRGAGMAFGIFGMAVLTGGVVATLIVAAQSNADFAIGNLAFYFALGILVNGVFAARARRHGTNAGAFLMIALASALSLCLLIWLARDGARFAPLNAERILIAATLVFQTLAFSFASPLFGLGREKPGFLRCFGFLAAGFALTGCVLTALILS